MSKQKATKAAGIFLEEIGDDYDPYFSLVVAILNACYEDYRHARAHGDIRTIKECEHFIYSDDFAKLTDVDPDLFVELMKRNAKTKRQTFAPPRRYTRQTVTHAVAEWLPFSGLESVTIPDVVEGALGIEYTGARALSNLVVQALMAFGWFPTGGRRCVASARTGIKGGYKLYARRK